MTITLLPVNGVGQPVRIPPERCPVLVGRSLTTDIPLGDPWVSHCHCSIDAVDGAVLVRDFGSSNGTWINGARVRESLLLPGDRLRIGSSEFILSIQGSGAERHELIPSPPIWL